MPVQQHVLVVPLDDDNDGNDFSRARSISSSRFSAVLACNWSNCPHPSNLSTCHHLFSTITFPLILVNGPWITLASRPRNIQRDLSGRFIPSTQSSTTSESSLSSYTLGTPASFGSFSPDLSRSTSPDRPDQPPIYTWPPPPPPPPPPSPIPTPDPGYEMPDSLPKLFWGDVGRSGEDAQDFINSIERTFIGKANATDADKIKLLRLSLKAGAEAHIWFKDLDADTKTSWAALETAFNLKWPEKVAAAKSKDEKKTKLRETLLREGDVGKRITDSDGIEEWAHVAWANRVERLAEAIPDRDGLLIDATRLALPTAVKSLLGSYDTWPEFCDAVRALSRDKLKENVAKEKEIQMLREEIDELKRAKQTPSKPLAAAFRNVNLGQPIPPPRFVTPQPNNPRPPNPFYTAPPNPAPYVNRTPAERWADAVKLALPIHPNTPAGKALYEAQIVEWTSKHGGKGPNEHRPYPLSPGSSPVATGECWGCGSQGHRGSSCPGTHVIPPLERRWRSIASTIKKGLADAPSSTPVNFVNETEWFSREEYDAQVIHDYHQAQAEAQRQGKEEGSST
ncbi:hypothetical protein FPV67DRAFT_1783129 [Lyophyllum atratum]|nr:hypothetical protein FPV67DRAFT_1783129 [Lyophyllum atratum]